MVRRHSDRRGRAPARPVRARSRPPRCARSPRPRPYGRPMTGSTHEVTNQPPPLVGHDVFRADAALVEAVAAVRRGGAPRRPVRPRPPGRLGAGPALGRRGEREPAGAAHPRPVRPPGRRGRLPPVLARPDGRRGRRGPARGGLDRGPRRPRAPGGRLRRLVAGRGGARLPGVDDVRRGARPADRPGAGRRVRAGAHGTVVRPRPAGPVGQGRAARRHGHDREAGRLRRPGQHDPGGARWRRRRVPADRAQVVLLGADVRRVPGAGPGARRADLLRGAAGAAGRDPQHLPAPAAEGQAGQPVQRLGRGRARRHLGPPARRRGPRRAHHHRDGVGDPAGLRPRARPR